MKLKKLRLSKLSIINHYQLLTILLLAAFVRFGGLSWCLPYTPHPDEWNMAAAVTRLNWANKLNPQFFAYGQFSLYLAYFSAQIYNLLPWVRIKEITTQEAIFFLRLWSAAAGVSTVYFVYLISKKLLTSRLALLTAVLAALTPGLIQIAHFGTTESFLSLFFLLVIYLCLSNLEKEHPEHYILLGIILGLAVGTKISALFFASPVLLMFAIRLATFKNYQLKNLRHLFLNTSFFLLSLIIFTLLSSPHLILSFEESKRILLYEMSVATGKLPIFYTRQFINTMPVVFQLQKIFPYALGWPIFILGTLGIIWSSFLFTNKNKLQLLTLKFALLVYFFSQAFLFCKWTRFMAPIFAFFPIFAGLFLQKFFSLLRSKPLIDNCQILITLLAIIPGILFSTIYFFPDVRFTASQWIYQNIPPYTQILYDTGNVVDIPIRSPNYQSLTTNYPLVSFDFYHLDENPNLLPKLLNYLESSDYIIVPSRRIFMNHLRLREYYPQTAKYYSFLFNGELGYELVAKIEPFYSQIFKDEVAEETFTVFDHPTIRIYKKIVKHSVKDYENLFQ